MSYNLNHVTVNGLTLHYNTTQVYRGSKLVYTGTVVTLAILTKLAVVLKANDYSLATEVAQ